MAKRKAGRGGQPLKTDQNADAFPPMTGDDEAPQRPRGKDTGPLDAEDVRAILKELTQSAVDFVDNEVSPGRALATKFYKGEPLGNEEEGRSQVVMTTLRDVILGVMPAFLRTFFGRERAVEFVPKRADQVAAAEQQSEYITHLFSDTPDALLHVQALFKDGCRGRLGFVKWWNEKVQSTTTQTYTGITDDQLALLAAEPDVQYTVLKSYTVAGPALSYTAGLGGAAMPPPPPVSLHDCSVTKITKKNVPTWAAVPPEEIVWSRSARTFHGNTGRATLIAHRQDRRVGDLVKLGFDFDELIENAGKSEKLTLNAENIERQPRTTTLIDQEETADPSMWMIPFYEAYCRVDEDNDHIPELRKYFLCGEYHLLAAPRADGEPESPFLGVEVPEVPIAYWCPDPEPHTVEGQGYGDFLMDLQRIDTALIRGQLDSLGLALNPRVAFKVGDVNMHDVMNTEVGAAIRTTGDPNTSIREFAHSYVGQQAQPLVDQFKQIRKERTGYAMESQDLSADVLQSTAKEGIQATLTASQGRTELLCRMAAEQLFVPLFRGLYRLVKQHQDYASVVRMNGKFVTVDPRTWDDDCEVQVKLLLGGGLAEERIASMAAIVAKQEQWMAQLGPTNPIVNLAQYTRACAKLTELGGHPEAPGTYFTVITDEQAAQIAQQAQAAAAQKAPSDPAMIVAQAQAQNIQHEMQSRDARLQLEQQKFQADQAMEAEKLRQQFIIAMKQIEAQNQVKLNEQQAESFIEGQKNTLEAEGEAAKIQAKTAVEVHKIETHAAVAREKNHLEAGAKVVTAHVGVMTAPTSSAEEPA